VVVRSVELFGVPGRRILGVDSLPA